MKNCRFCPTIVRAFTLIELLVVVAIIAILAAIAVPNFLEAQVRSKISRVRSDLRTMATGIESYTIDNNRVPFDGSRGGDHRGWATVQSSLTTPISYLTSLLPDVFQDRTLTDSVPAPNTSFFVDSNNSRHAYDYGTAEWHNVGVTTRLKPRAGCGPLVTANGKSEAVGRTLYLWIPPLTSLALEPAMMRQTAQSHKAIFIARRARPSNNLSCGLHRRGV